MNDMETILLNVDIPKIHMLLVNLTVVILVISLAHQTAYSIDVHTPYVLIRRISHNLMMIMPVSLRFCGRSEILLSGDSSQSPFMFFGWRADRALLEDNFLGDKR